MQDYSNHPFYIALVPWEIFLWNPDKFHLHSIKQTREQIDMTATQKGNNARKGYFFN